MTGVGTNTGVVASTEVRASTGDRLRAVALGLTGVEERETWHKPTFRVGGKLFLTLGPDGSTATMKATVPDQVALIAADPGVFSAAAYLGRYGWITLSLDRCDLDEVEALVVDAWRQTAPRPAGDRRARSGDRKRQPRASGQLQAPVAR
jgi:hypothetical protein